MKCPYCYNQMEIGRLQSPHELAWLKGLKKVSEVFPDHRLQVAKDTDFSEET